MNELIGDHVGPIRVRDRTNDQLELKHSPTKPTVVLTAKARLLCVRTWSSTGSSASTKGTLKSPSGEVEINVNTN